MVMAKVAKNKNGKIFWLEKLHAIFLNRIQVRLSNQKQNLLLKWKSLLSGVIKSKKLSWWDEG